MEPSDKHFENNISNILVVDGSTLTRTLIKRIILKTKPDAQVIDFELGKQATNYEALAKIDLVVTALRLPDQDGLEFVEAFRQKQQSHYVPIVIVSGDVSERLRYYGGIEQVTDYFDKSQGLQALGSFIDGYINPPESIRGNILLIEDSRVVALATKKMLTKFGFEITHVTSIDEAFTLIDNKYNKTDQTESSNQHNQQSHFDVILSDVYLKGDLTGKDLLQYVRVTKNIGFADLPIIVVTGEDDSQKRADLLKMGANDLVVKPVEEFSLVKKLAFQLQITQHHHALKQEKNLQHTQS